MDQKINYIPIVKGVKITSPALDMSKVKLMQDGVLTVGMKVGYPPFEDFAEDGTTPIGYDVDFAKALSGGDKSKIETLRNAFKEGFESAKEAFGGELPEISQQTYDKVMQGFDDWAKEE